MNNVKLIQKLVEHGSLHDAVDENDRTPLSTAARNGYDEVVWELIRCEARMDIKGIDVGIILRCAVDGENEDAVELLLEHDSARALMTRPIALDEPRDTKPLTFLMILLSCR